MTRWTSVAALAFAVLGTSARAETIYGYVTRVDSLAEFDVGTMHIVLSKNATCVLELVGIAHGPCNPKAVDVYSNVRLVGKIRSSDGAFLVSKLTIDDFALSPYQMSDGIILEENTILSKGKHGLNRKIWMDGYPITITPQTQIFHEPTDTTFSFGDSGANITAKAKRHSEIPPHLSSATSLRNNFCIVFHSVRTPNSTITATKLQFWPNWVDSKEKQYDKKFSVAIHPPDYSKGIPGTIQYQGAAPIMILPDKVIQDWVSSLGNALIPACQKNLPDTNPTKINFRFYVVHAFPARLGRYFVETGSFESGSFMPENQMLYWDRWSGTFYNKPLVNAMVHNIVAAPDGTVLIPDGVLVELQNSAQLATFLSTAITSVVQRQIYHTFLLRNHYSQFINPFPVEVGAWENEQALRIGIRQMYLAGYDIREAPYAWAVGRDEAAHNPIKLGRPFKGHLWYAAYAFNYISHYYSDVDYSKLKRGEHEYQQFLQELYKADPSLPRPQAQLEPQASTRPRAAAQPAPQSSPAAPTASAPPAASPVAPSSATPAITQAH